MISVSCLVKNYDDPAKVDLKVHNHWNVSELVVLEINGEKYTVKSRDLKAAIENCINTNRYS